LSVLFFNLIHAFVAELQFVPLRFLLALFSTVRREPSRKPTYFQEFIYTLFTDKIKARTRPDA
jgi:hypothetical protein